VLGARLEDRFRDALGPRASPAREPEIRFAAAFARMLARILPPGPVHDGSRSAMSGAIAARTGLGPDDVALLLALALRPEARTSITEDDLRAFGSRFGRAEEEALRAAVREELDLARFAEQYGSAEALLLLDALFRVCAVDGAIDRAETGRLTRAAVELNIDPQLVGVLFRKHDARHRAGELTFELAAGERFVLGRSPTVDLHLPDPQIADRHAEITRTSEGWRVSDLGSGRPTLLNGSMVRAAPFGPNDQLRLGSYALAWDGPTLVARPPAGFSALSVRHLSRRIGATSLLDDVSFTVFTGEVIAVVGPSGSGKTTLLNAITGVAPADSGDVIYDGASFHSQLQRDPSLVGTVPQDDVVHPELTVEESLRFSARLRMPYAPEAELAREVERVLDELDVRHIRHARIGDAVRRGISGGQRKRVNVGQELLTASTRVLFLDEPTSGLDPNTSQEMVSLVRQLADGGRIVFLVTHDVSPSILAQVDHLLVLARGGRVAWFGPPGDACTWFDVRSPDQIFSRLSTEDPTTWAQRYRDGQAFRKFVRTREHLLGLDGIEAAPSRPVAVRPFAGLRHYGTLTRRTLWVKLRDRGGLGVLLAQAPILGIAMWLVFPAPQVSSLFMLALSSLWFGASASVRELIAERPIWRRDARGGIGPLPYLAAKLTVLGALVTLQCSALAWMNWWLLDMADYGFAAWQMAGVASATGLTGVTLGLALSAAFQSSEAAVGMLPLLLIPQITFGGLIVRVRDMGPAAEWISRCMVVRYSFDALIRTGETLSRPGNYGLERERLSISGFLYDLGLRKTASVSDMGLGMPTLLLALAGFSALFLVTSLGLVARSRRAGG